MTASIFNRIARFSMAWRLRAEFAENRPPRAYISSPVWSKNPGWGDEVFDRVIDRLEFYLPTGHKILLSGMRQYNFFVEAVQDLSGGRADIAAFWLCGRRPDSDRVNTWRVAEGKVIHNLVPWGREYANRPTRGWKPGTPGRPVSTLVKV